MVHIGISHNKLMEYVGAPLKKRISTKNIVLNIDSETRYFWLRRISFYNYLEYLSLSRFESNFSFYVITL